MEISASDKPRVQSSLVSVVIPVHNVEKTELCLKALRQQTYEPIEIIQVRFKGFPAEKRNSGFKKSHGALVLFLDEDEYLSPTVIEECVAKIRRGYYIVSIPVRKKLGKGYFRQCLSLIRENTVKSLFFRREVLLDVGLFDPVFVLSDDLDLLGRATRKHYPMATISEGYMFHDENVTVRSIIQKTMLTRQPFRKLRSKYGEQAFREMVRSGVHRRRIVKGLLGMPKYFFGVSLVMLMRAIIRRIP